MSTNLALDELEIQELRQQHYNGTVIKVTQIHDDLRIIRVRPDNGMPQFTAGQYTSLGLGYWERRVEGVQPEHLDDLHLHRVPKRAYSFSCSMLDDAANLVRVQDYPYLEFYVTLVRHADRHPPALTPRLFALNEGERLYIDPKTHGSYTLSDVQPNTNVVFLATGTGEAPHNAMVAELLCRNHQGRVISANCVRYRRDLGYTEVHRELERRYENYRYLALTTREPENLDPTTKGYVGKRYVQDYIQSGDFERDADLELDPENTHVYLCGSPAMIGIPVKHPGSQRREPQPGGMIDILHQRGFRSDEPKNPGNIHFERYW